MEFESIEGIDRELDLPGVRDIVEKLIAEEKIHTDNENQAPEETFCPSSFEDPRQIPESSYEDLFQREAMLKIAMETQKKDLESRNSLYTSLIQHLMAKKVNVDNELAALEDERKRKLLEAEKQMTALKKSIEGIEFENDTLRSHISALKNLM